MFHRDFTYLDEAPENWLPSIDKDDGKVSFQGEVNNQHLAISNRRE